MQPINCITFDKKRILENSLQMKILMFVVAVTSNSILHSAEINILIVLLERSRANRLRCLILITNIG